MKSSKKLLIMRVFVSSPGDVQEERRHIIETVMRLNIDDQYSGKVVFLPVAFDVSATPIPFPAHETPQTWIDASVTAIADCEIVIGVFASRLGTAFVDGRSKRAYDSGTAAELDHALVSYARSGKIKPFTLVFKRDAPVLPDPSDPTFPARRNEADRLKTYIDKTFMDERGGPKRAFNPYKDFGDFKSKFEKQIKIAVDYQIEQITKRSLRTMLRRAAVTLIPAIVILLLFFFAGYVVYPEARRQGVLRDAGLWCPIASVPSLAEKRFNCSEVTTWQFQQCVYAGVCSAPPQSGNPAYYRSGGDTVAAGGINAPNAERYCAWIAARLPTNVEWEALVTSDRTKKWPWAIGDTLPTASLAVLYFDDPPMDEAAPIGSRRNGVSSDGLVDLIGNVAEWVVWKNDPVRPYGLMGWDFRSSIAEGRFTQYGVPVSDPNEEDAASGIRCIADR